MTHRCPECGGPMVVTRRDESPIEEPDDPLTSDGGAAGPVAVELADEITVGPSTLVCGSCGAVFAYDEP